MAQIEQGAPVIAIIGAGFCGLMTAWQLMHQARDPLEIILFDDQPPGRGAAYRAISPRYLLNVPAGKMGALAGAPGHFFAWLEARLPGQYRPQDFVPRQLYGEYLEALLAQLRAAAGPARLREIPGRVIGLKQLAQGLELRLADGSSCQADRVVLAAGNQPPAHPRLLSGDPSRLPGYFQLPWQAACLAGLESQKPVLLLGSGLTMVDLALGLREQGFAGPIHAISPHGYLPLAHRPGPVWPDFLAGRSWPASLSQWLALVRTQVAQAQADGVDWRAVIDALRPYSVQIWQSLSQADRRRFLVHLRHRWGVLRHRLPAEVAARLAPWLAEGSLKVSAGRVESLMATAAGLAVDWRPRGGQTTERLLVQRVINCTGPDGRYLQNQDPLFVNLAAQGLLRADPLELGLAADAHGGLLDRHGQVSNRLYTLGTALRGLYWESTAVPELREQAARLAAHLLKQLESQSRNQV